MEPVVVIGGSAGSLDVITTILEAMPRSCVATFLVVVHIPADMPSLLAEVFALRCRLPISEAYDKSPLRPGEVLVGPPDYHLLCEPDCAALSRDPPVSFSRPSIDVFFESAAATFGPRAIGVAVSGASHDGALGLAAIAEAGGGVAIQAPNDAVAAELPRAALAAVPGAYVGLPDQLAAWLLTQLAAQEPP
ncbi:MAG: chemotaxis protein CheB [Kofleriaceae bacterium]